MTLSGIGDAVRIAQSAPPNTLSFKIDMRFSVSAHRFQNQRLGMLPAAAVFGWGLLGRFTKGAVERAQRTEPNRIGDF